MRQPSQHRTAATAIALNAVRKFLTALRGSITPIPVARGGLKNAIPARTTIVSGTGIQKTRNYMLEEKTWNVAKSNTRDRNTRRRCAVADRCIGHVFQRWVP